MKGITTEWGRDSRNNDVLIIKKSRGKLSISEIGDILRYEGNGSLQGHYAIHINASESTCGGSGWMDDDQSEGDTIELLQINDLNDCPICGRVTPPFLYCPHCGESWKEGGS